jgi:hypothetical protein
MDEIQEALKALYYDPSKGFGNMKKFKDRVKESGLKATKDEIENFYKSQSIVQVMKPIIKQKKYSSIYSLYSGHLYQMDIMIYDRYQYGHYKYILCVIDVYSRYAEARALTNRTNDNILKNMIDIFKTMKEPEQIQCDNEFNKNLFNEYFKERDIKVIYSDPDMINKNAIVERFNKTLAILLQKIRIGTKNYNWPSFLKDAINNYNTSIHSTTKETPKDIFTNEKRNRQQILLISNPFKVGDKVRVVRKKKLFDKADVISFSTTTHIITKIKGDKINIDDLPKNYKPYELVNITEISSDNIGEPKNEIKENNLKKLLKRLDIDEKNIITEKRTRK